MLRFIVVAVILFGFLGGSIGRLHRLKELSKSNPNQMEEESLRIVRKMFRLILHIAGVSVTVKGMENIPKGQPVLYVGNTGVILTFWWAIPRFRASWDLWRKRRCCGIRSYQTGW